MPRCLCMHYLTPPLSMSDHHTRHHYKIISTAAFLLAIEPLTRIVTPQALNAAARAMPHKNEFE